MTLPHERLLIDSSKRGDIPMSLTTSQMEARDRLIQALSDGRIKVEPVEKCLCGSSSLMKIADRDRHGLNFAAFLCIHCGLVLTNPALAEDSLPTYYSQYYQDLNFPCPSAAMDSLFRGGHGGTVFTILRRALPNKKILSVLDVGAGTGSVTLEFKKAAAAAGFSTHATVLDYSPMILEKLANVAGIDVIVGGLEHLRERPGTYDVVIMSHVLEHFKNIEQQMSFVKPHLTSNSLLYVGVPGLLRLKHACEYACDFLQYFTSAHMYHFNLEALRYTMALYGFRCVRGDQSVNAVFSPGQDGVDISGNAAKILSYLGDLERNLSFYQHICCLRKRVFGFARKNGRISAIVDRTAGFLRASGVRYV